MGLGARFMAGWERVLSIGEHPGETIEQRGRRRIIVGVFVASLLPRTLDGVASLDEQPAVGLAILGAVTVTVIGIAALKLWPRRYTVIVNVMILALLVEPTAETLFLGGIVESSAVIAWSILAVLVALLGLSVRAAGVWFVVVLATVILAVQFPSWVDPLYAAEPSASEIAFSVSGVAVFTFATLLYFIRQRDRFQQQSDDLLHNIFPDEIATRLKTDTSMIADDFPQASVLFADVVGFTPMSATMTPPQLVGLLNQVFTTFDQFVAELGLEKIKTVGDEYMAAAGVPVPRPDHAEAIAELALRIRDCMATRDFDGHRLELRIGIHSGPVVAGIIGTHKFAYDLWGDTVNTASRMESGGIPGQIQVTPATHQLLTGNGYTFEPRGTIDVKGKGTMDTWILTGRS